MAYTPTVWAPGNRIMTSDTLGTGFNINRIETGIDDIYNNAMTFLKNKKFVDGIRLTETTGFVELQLTAAERYRLKVLAGSYSAYFDDRLNLGLPLLFDDNVELLDINSVIPEGHGTRHNRIGADFVPQYADVIVSKSGDGGEFTDIPSAVSVLGNGEVLMIRDGTFDCPANINMPPYSTLIGQGDNTLVRFTSASYRLNTSGVSVTIRDIAIKNEYITSQYAVNITGHDAFIDNVTVYANHGALSLGGTRSIAKDCNLISIRTTTNPTYGMTLVGIDNRMIGCRLSGFGLGVDVNSIGSVITGNRILGNSITGGYGIMFRPGSLYSLCYDNVVTDTLPIRAASIYSNGTAGNHLIRGNIIHNSSNGDATTIVVDNLLI